MEQATSHFRGCHVKSTKDSKKKNNSLQTSHGCARYRLHHFEADSYGLYIYFFFRSDIDSERKPALLSLDISS